MRTKSDFTDSYTTTPREKKQGEKYTFRRKIIKKHNFSFRSPAEKCQKRLYAPKNRRTAKADATKQTASAISAAGSA